MPSLHALFLALPLHQLHFRDTVLGYQTFLSIGQNRRLPDIAVTVLVQYKTIVPSMVVVPFDVSLDNICTIPLQAFAFHMSHTHIGTAPDAT